MPGLGEAVGRAVRDGRLSERERWVEAGVSGADQAFKDHVRRLRGKPTREDYRDRRRARRVRQRREREARKAFRGALPAHPRVLAMVAAGGSDDVNARHARLLLSSYRRARVSPCALSRVRAPRRRQSPRRSRAQRGVRSTRGPPGESEGEPEAERPDRPGTFKRAIVCASYRAIDALELWWGGSSPIAELPLGLWRVRARLARSLASVEGVAP
jgi:hypothetical protein